MYWACAKAATATVGRVEQVTGRDRAFAELFRSNHPPIQAYPLRRRPSSGMGPGAIGDADLAKATTPTSRRMGR
jgi:hypothetical protein